MNLPRSASEHHRDLELATAPDAAPDAHRPETHRSDTQPTDAQPMAPAALEVVRWPDPRLDGTGHDPRSLYAERFWLGLLGPSALWMMRRFARGLESHPSGFRVSLIDTGRSLGLGDSVARNSSTQRTITRLCQFGLAQRIEPVRLAVRTELPLLNKRQLSRLPESLQSAHTDWTSGRTHDQDRLRAQAAAEGLAHHGESFEIIERQLRTWGYPSAVAYDAARAAIAEDRRIDLRTH